MSGRVGVLKNLLNKLKIHPDPSPQLLHDGPRSFRAVAPGSQPKEDTPQGPQSRAFDISYYKRDTRRMIDANFRDVKLQDTSLKASAVYTDMPEHLPTSAWIKNPDLLVDHSLFLVANDLPPTPGIAVPYHKLYKAPY
eukprot:c23157_g1_i1.p1 GENE.c23157_g1_i1~~c23157_g1_i1.p1  ORF type:complete len:149 (+),score=33.31 c23157_g1_i1:36-449(+)